MHREVTIYIYTGLEGGKDLVFPTPGFAPAIGTMEAIR